MADDSIGVAASGSPSNKVDASLVTVGGVPVDRQRVNISDPTAANSHANVTSAAPAGTEGGLIVRPIENDVVTTGTITATDAVVAAPGGTGAFVSGTSTAGSYVVTGPMPGGDSAWNLQITGLTSGTLYFEGSLDSTTGADGNWINVNGRQTGVVNTVLAGSTTTNGMYRGNTSGLKYFRVRSVGALTGTPAIVIRVSDGVGAIFLNASVPAGSNLIGNLNIGPSGAAAAVQSSNATGSEIGLVVREAAPAHTYATNTSTSVAASGNLVTGYLSLGATPSVYTWLEGYVYTNQSGTFRLDGSDGTNLFFLASGYCPSGVPVQVRVPAPALHATASQFRMVYLNGSITATQVLVSVSLKAS